MEEKLNNSDVTNNISSQKKHVLLVKKYQKRKIAVFRLSSFFRGSSVHVAFYMFHSFEWNPSETNFALNAVNIAIYAYLAMFTAVAVDITF